MLSSSATGITAHPPHHDVVIVGAGNAGVSLAARLRRLGCRDVALVDPRRTHRYRPLLNYVAGGQVSLARLRRSMSAVVPRGVTWVRRAVVAVHAEDRAIELDDGSRLGYGDLVLAPGLEVDPDAISGLAQAVRAGWATSAHVDEQAQDVWRAVRDRRAGRVVFTLPPEPAPCGGTALKPLLLACDHWRREGVLGAMDVHLVTPWSTLLDLPFGDRRLEPELSRLGVTVHHGAKVAELDHRTRTVVLATPGGQLALEEVEHAFVVPHYRGHGWLRPLAGEGPSGLVDVDPETMAHRRAERVWALGDAAELRTRPSGGALRRQVDVLADNIRRRRLGEPLRRYDGYTIIPVTVDRRRALLLEFDRDGVPQPTLRWWDLTAPSRAVWVFDRFVEPVVYFGALLRGRV